MRVAIDELHAGRGQLLLLTGDSGVGKTRLLAEVATIAGDGSLWLGAQTRSFGSELLYGPFVAILRSWLGAEPGEAEVSVRTKLRSKLAALPELDLKDAGSKLGALLGLHDDGQDPARDRRPRSRDSTRLWRLARCAGRPPARRDRDRRLSVG